MLSDGLRTYTWEHGRQLQSVTAGNTAWYNYYDENGIRTERTRGTVSYKYSYEGGKLKYMSVGTNKLYFTYDFNGAPLSVNYNGTEYYYVTNLQGDVVAILNAAGTAVVTYTYDAWGNPLTQTGSMSSTLGTHNPLRYRGYVYDTDTGLYYLLSRYYDPQIGRFINADGFVSTGQGLVGNNMFAYCNNNPLYFKDPTGTRLVINDPASDFEYLNNYDKTEATYFTASLGLVLAIGIGPLSASLQLNVVSDASGNSELQVSYTAPNIFNSNLPSTDEMMSQDSNWRFNAAIAGTISFTNAHSVYDLYGPSFSTGGAITGVAFDYNIIPKADDSSQAYQGITIAGGMITPGFNIGMSNTVYGVPLPFTVFELADAAYKGWLGVQ